ncbi:MAG: hypothetical protein E7335_10930 [Clostridiales bacterium]|nr:hypothetical protein [Clostridiales bacterium]
MSHLIDFDDVFSTENPSRSEQAEPSPSPNPTPRRNASSIKIGFNRYRGRVRRISHDHTRPSFAERIIDTLIFGKPFSMAPVLFTVDIGLDSFANAQSEYNSTRSITFYQENTNIPIYNDDLIIVHGKKSFNGTIFASSIQNTQNNVKLFCGFPAWGVRLIVLTALLFIFYIGSALLTGISMPSADSSLTPETTNALSYIILILLALYALVSAMRKNRKLRSTILWVGAILLSALFFPTLGYIIVAIFAIKLMLGI